MRQDNWQQVSEPRKPRVRGRETESVAHFPDLRSVCVYTLSNWRSIRLPGETTGWFTCAAKCCCGKAGDLAAVWEAKEGKDKAEWRGDEYVNGRRRGEEEPGLRGSKILTLTDCYGFSQALERGSAPDFVKPIQGSWCLGQYVCPML